MTKIKLEKALKIIEGKIELAINTLLDNPDHVNIEVLSALLQIRKELKNGEFTWKKAS